MGDTPPMPWLRSATVLFLTACGTNAPVGDGSSSTASTGGGSTGASASGSTGGTVDSSGPSSSDDTVDPTVGTTTFGMHPDGGCTISQCDVWAQDCPRGEKCVPWSANGDGTFGGCSDARCSEVTARPHLAGEPCTAQDGPWSGVDDCELGAYCWAVDVATGAGVCVQQCGGTEDEPACSDPDLTCYAMHGTSVTACVPSCDPLAPSCAAGTACTLSTGSDFGPLCLAVDLGVVETVGSPCDLRVGCGDGLACLPAEAVADCDGAGCCATLCELSEQTCPADTACTALQAAPMGVGACAAA